MKLRMILETIAKILFYVLSFIAIYFIILKLTNHSPTVESVTWVMLGSLLVLTIATNRNVVRVEERLKYNTKILNSLANDFKDHLKSHK